MGTSSMDGSDVGDFGGFYVIGRMLCNVVANGYPGAVARALIRLLLWTTVAMRKHKN